jgi:flagellum-specific peptidoglycan hydrolase FlgJ
MLNKQQLDFLKQVVPPARQSDRDYEIPACDTIAQAILESATPSGGWGTSPLFLQAKNPFGIKFSHYCPPSTSSTSSTPSRLGAVEKVEESKKSNEDYGEFSVETQEIKNGQIVKGLAQFQRFPDLTSAFRAHAQLLLDQPRYQSAMAVRSDWRKFAVALMDCGYSTDRPGICQDTKCLHYAGKLIELVTKYSLNDSGMLESYATWRDPEKAEESKDGTL